MRSRLLVAMMVLGVTLQACSSKPREFAPRLAALPVDQQAFQEADSTCRQLIADGKLDSSGRLASGGVGAATGATTMAVGSAAAATVGGYSGLAVASLTVVALPFAVLGGAWGMARAKRAKKERKIQRAMSGCLEERGYTVAKWERVKNRRAKAAVRTAATDSHSD